MKLVRFGIMSVGNFLEHPVLVGLLQKTRWNCLLLIGRKSKVVAISQKEVGGRGKKSRWQVTQGTLSNFFSIIGLLKKCICGTTNIFSPNCYPDQEENSGKSFKNTGQSRQLIIRPSLLYTQCLKIFPTTVDLITFRSGWL